MQRLILTANISTVLLELVIELRIQGMEWNNDLQDKRSEAYRNLSFLVEREVTICYHIHILYPSIAQGESLNLRLSEESKTMEGVFF